MSDEQSQTVDSNVSQPPVPEVDPEPTAAAPTSPMPDEGEGEGTGGKTKIRIGSQRPQAPRVKAAAKRMLVEHSGPKEKTPIPNRRAGLPPELEAELEEALGGV